VRRYLACLLLPALPAFAQEVKAPTAAPSFHLSGELKAGLRYSKAQESPIFFPFPEGFLPPGQTASLRTPDAGTSLEVQYLALAGEGEITSGVSAAVEVRLLDLYNRNPTSSDDRVLVRQAYVTFGAKPRPLDGQAGSHAYVQVGLAPRFTKRMTRNLEGYGLWSTAVGRFEQPQAELGLSAGHLYARGMVGNGNPVFMRDTNALAGDNGTPERQPGNVRPIYQSGFPIFYDAKPTDVDFSGRFEWGAGVGLRVGGGEHTGADVLGWYFARRLADAVPIRGTNYLGDLTLLRGNGVPLPIEGDRKHEWGVTLQAKLAGAFVYGQYVDQEIAGLGRRGLEIEAAYRIDLPGLFLIKESPFGNWMRPVVRYSSIDNLFTGPREYPALSALWDWKKYDAGLRVGLVRGVDLTAEYTVHHIVRPRGGNLPMNELLVTMRAALFH
jgi:hypothetical protein